MTRFYDYENNSVYINRDDVVSIEPCDSRPLSFIRLRGTDDRIQVKGRPDEVASVLFPVGVGIKQT